MVLVGIAMIFLCISFISIISVYPVVKKKIGKILCLALFLIGISGFVSVCFSIRNSDRIDRKTSYKEYEIQKATTSHVYFNDMKMSYKDVVVEKPISNYQNVVVSEKQYYKTKWLWLKFKYSDNKYHVYFSDDIYQEYLKDRNVIYER